MLLSRARPIQALWLLIKSTAATCRVNSIILCQNSSVAARLSCTECTGACDLPWSWACGTPSRLGSVWALCRLVSLLCPGMPTCVVATAACIGASAGLATAHASHDGTAVQPWLHCCTGMLPMAPGKLRLQQQDL